MSRPPSAPGRNITFKVPPHPFDATVSFYRDPVGRKETGSPAPEVVAEFDGVRLWVDRAPCLSQAEIWLELKTPDPGKAASFLAAPGVERFDGIEPLPEGFKGFRISSPAQVAHLVAQGEEP